MRLGIVVSTGRPGRASKPIADWFLDRARALGAFEAELLDLKDFDLPLFDEASHPARGQYEGAHTKRWSEAVARCDAFVFVTAEYNHGPPSPLLNAIAYLAREWAYKPLGFVSYGGTSGGLRSVQVLKQMVVALKMMPIPEAVVVHMVAQMIDREQGRFVAGELQEKAVAPLLDELARWTRAMAALRS